MSDTTRDDLSPSPSPSPTASTPDTPIVTPDQLYHPHDPPLITSPDMYDMAPPLAVHLSPKHTSRSPEHMLHNHRAPESQSSMPATPIRHDGTLRTAANAGGTSIHRPPPITVRQPADLHSTLVVDDEPRGLLISGLPAMSGSIERDEEQDGVSELAPSPHRALFANATPTGAPTSPAWPSLEQASPRFNGSPHARSPSSVSMRHSLQVPYSPLGPRSGANRFDPTPNHGIHSRNLSLYFPQPGTQHEPDSIEIQTPEDDAGAPVGLPLSAGGGEEKRRFGGAGDWSFGSAKASSLAVPVTPNDSKQGKRRGHHHKHSLSHNFFSFLDPTQTNPALSQPSASNSPDPRAVDTPQPVPMPLMAAPAIVPSAGTSLSPLPPPRHNSHRQMLFWFGALEFLIGSGLWVEGQISGWRCLAALGYLVVFDSMGVAVCLLGERPGWSSTRQPYGAARFLSLLYFSQSLFLVFSAVYMAKESIEQVVLGAGAHEHAVGGSHGHGEAVVGGDERTFPHFLLALAAMASMFSGAVLQNHTTLVQAVGPLFLPSRYISLKFVQNHPSFLGNPFTLTIAGGSLAVLLGGLTSTQPSLHSLDSALSLVLTILTTALAYPTVVAFGHVLLQTAPPASSTRMRQVKRVLKEISADDRVLGVGTLRCWSIGATGPIEDRDRVYVARSSVPESTASSPRTPRSEKSPAATPTSPAFPASFKIGEGAPLVLSLLVHVHPEVSDKDVLQVTRMAWSRLSLAAGTGTGTGAVGGGEVSIGIRRGWEGVE